MIRKDKRTQEERTIKGITLIALVVTIVVLLILAGVTINAVLGDNGIIAQAQKAADAAEQAAKNDEDNIKDLAEQINNMTNDPQTTIEEAIAKGEDFAKDGNQDVVDEFGNPVTIPQGFHIVTHKEDETVDYNYSETKKGTPTVQDGIVIEDENDNQFVWIPVGTIKNSDGSTTKIELARRTFNADGSVETELTDGTVLKDGSYEYTEDSNDNGTGKSEKGNAIAKNIEEFKTSANTKGGYYLARYEAVKNSDTNKVVSKPGKVWKEIKQIEASEEARKMYTEKPYESDLTNSYAWDTAIVFIQIYGGNGYEKYSMQKSENSSVGNTGERPNDNGENTTDKVCNIYDMAGNFYEWTTETYNSSSNPYVSRGGYATGYVYPASREYSYGYASSVISFRPTLYVALNAEEQS